jgi:hypothetical protein
MTLNDEMRIEVCFSANKLGIHVEKQLEMVARADLDRKERWTSKDSTEDHIFIGFSVRD